jgi:hypothetical protein
MKRNETCKIENCNQPVKAKGYCRKHYRKWRHGEYGNARYKTCVAEGCRKPRFAKGYCEDHYQSLFLSRAVAKRDQAQTESPAPE